MDLEVQRIMADLKSLARPPSDGTHLPTFEQRQTALTASHDDLCPPTSGECCLSYNTYLTFAMFVRR
jgi:hypothetical protein